MRLARMRDGLARLDPERWPDVWWQAAVLLLTGYAAAKLAGEATFAVAVAFVAVVLAVLHHFLPGVVELVAGISGLVAGVVGAAKGDCHALVGGYGVGVLVGFGGGMCVSAIVRLLGSGSIREAARHLLVAAAVLELGLSAVAPTAEAVEGFQANAGTATALAVLLAGLTLVALWARAGLPVLGVSVLAVQVLLAASSGPCHTVAGQALVGMLVFAGVGTAIARSTGTPATATGPAVREDWAGKYDGRGPEPEPPSAEEWPGRGLRPPRQRDDSGDWW